MDEYGALVEWYLQGEIEIFGVKPVSVPLSLAQIPHGLSWNRTRASDVDILSYGREISTVCGTRQFFAIRRPLTQLQPFSAVIPLKPILILFCLHLGYSSSEVLTPGRQVARASKFCTVAPNICGFSARNLLHVLMESRISRQLLRFSKMCAPLSYLPHPFKFCD
jgi:hypothetical protein